MANQTLPVDVSYEYEMNKNKTRQCDGEKSTEEILCSSSSDTAEELCSSSADNTCRDRRAFDARCRKKEEGNQLLGRRNSGLRLHLWVGECT